jgi:hypothetical protein
LNSPDLSAAAFSSVVISQSKRFKKTQNSIDALDPKIQTPILTLFLDAATEALVSKSTYADYFLKIAATDAQPEILELLIKKIEKGENLTAKKLPFLYGALKDAYEHIFSFTIKMLHQFQSDFRRMPDSGEFEQLRVQLTRLFFDEALLPRRENAAFEAWFLKADRYFYFEQKDSDIKLHVVQPSAAWQAEALQNYDQSAEGKYYAELDAGMHYGCPARAHVNGEPTTTLQFVVKDVFSAVQQSFWRTDAPSEELIRTEKIYRHKLRDAAESLIY